MIDRCPRWCCASSFAKSPGTTQEGHFFHGCMVYYRHVLTVDGSEIPNTTTGNGCFWNLVNGINYSTNLNWVIQPDFWLPSIGNLRWFEVWSLTVPAMSWWPALKVVEGRCGPRESNFGRWWFFFGKISPNWLGVETTWLGGGWKMMIFRYLFNRKWSKLSTFFQGFFFRDPTPPSWSTVARWRCIFCLRLFPLRFAPSRVWWKRSLNQLVLTGIYRILFNIH